MKITGPGPISNQSKVGGTKSSGDGSFGKMLDAMGQEKEVEATSGIARLTPVNFIPLVDSDEKSKRKQLVADGDDILDELLKLRDALLLGSLSAERLRAIEAKISKIEADCDDPLLNEIIEEIKIRAAVELAKLGF